MRKKAIGQKQTQKSRCCTASLEDEIRNHKPRNAKNGSLDTGKGEKKKKRKGKDDLLALPEGEQPC